MENLPEKKENTILDHIPSALGMAAVTACLIEYPFHMVAINLAASVGGKFLTLRNEKQAEILLQAVAKKVDELDKTQKIIKEQLKENIPYQEAAHKRLSLISALDTEEDLKLSACLVVLCGTLTGENPKDKFLLQALGEISVSEVRLFCLIEKKRKKMALLESKFTDDEKGDLASINDLGRTASIELFNEGEKLLGMYNFTHLMARIHSFGLIEAANLGGFSDYNLTPKVYPSKLTPVGDYFVVKLEAMGFDFF